MRRLIEEALAWICAPFLVLAVGFFVLLGLTDEQGLDQ